MKAIRHTSHPTIAWLVWVVMGISAGCASDEPALSYQSQRAHIMNEVGFKSFHRGDLQGALVNFQKALQAAESTDDRREIVRARINIGQVLSAMNQGEEAGSNFEKALRVARDLDEEELLFNALQATGKHLVETERFEEAEALLLEAGEIAEDLESNEKLALTLNDLSVVYMMTGRNEEAQENLLHALFLYENLEGLVSIEGRASVSNNLAEVRKAQGRYQDAWSLLTNSLACYQQLGDKEALVKCHANMGALLEVWGKHSDALLRYERAYGVAKEIPNPKWMELYLEQILRLTKDLGMDRLHQQYARIMEEFRRIYKGKSGPP